jgi:hypothetical protein
LVTKKEIEQKRKEILKKYTEGKPLTSEEVINGFTVRTYGHLNTERLVRNLLKAIRQGRL